MNNKPTALITGASSGIGLELSKLFAYHGYNLVLVARSYETLKTHASKLENRYGTLVKCCSKDLAVSSSPDEIFQSLKSDMIEIDVLVNNAGFGWRGEFTSMELSDALEMIQVNITALTHLTRLLLPEMLKRRQGRIMNVSSTASFQPGPLMAIYYASKAFVTSFSLALSEELRGSGITVTAFCPGPTATGFGKRAGYTNEKILGNHFSMDAPVVALHGYKGLMKGKPLVISGWKNCLGVQIVRFLPRVLPGKLIKIIQEKRGK
ncbi:MAG: SDR family oxidoreductase [Bacteroidetes bacterium]|nr:SDR family oxidoreductase [Bacteroidota bacterium]